MLLLRLLLYVCFQMRYWIVCDWAWLSFDILVVFVFFSRFLFHTFFRFSFAMWKRIELTGHAWHIKPILISFGSWQVGGGIWWSDENDVWHLRPYNTHSNSGHSYVKGGVRSVCCRFYCSRHLPLRLATSATDRTGNRCTHSLHTLSSIIVLRANENI